MIFERDFQDFFFPLKIISGNIVVPEKILKAVNHKKNPGTGEVFKISLSSHTWLKISLWGFGLGFLWEKSTLFSLTRHMKEN